MLVLVKVWLNISIFEHILDGREQDVLLLHREGCLAEVCAEQTLKVKIRERLTKLKLFFDSLK